MPKSPRKKTYRTVRRGSGRGPSRRWRTRIVGIAIASLLLSLILAAVLGSCHKKNPPQPRTEARHEQLAADFQEVIANTGGSQVWIKQPPGAHHGKNVDTPLEVVAASGVFASLEPALRRDAVQHKLDFAATAGAQASGLRTTSIDVSLHGHYLFRARLREVPRLLHAAIVIDDLGSEPEPVQKLLALPYPITYSILPYLHSSQATAEDVHRAGREVMLHLPMEAEPGPHPAPGEGMIRTGMGEAEALRVLESDLAAVPFVRGVNNHMGSRATQNRTLMAEVIKGLAERKLFFIDSRTTAESVALEAARRQGVPTFYRSVFLDDQETVPYTLGQLRELRHVVEEQGAALAIGHPHPTTIAALAQFLPELERADIELVPASRLVRLPEVAHLHPPGSKKQGIGNREQEIQSRE